MSDTPRTEARVRRIMDNDGSATDLESFTCQLERELNAANERIKRLEEAGGLALGYASKGDFESADEVWSKAKEAQP